MYGNAMFLKSQTHFYVPESVIFAEAWERWMSVKYLAFIHFDHKEFEVCNLKTSLIPEASLISLWFS